MEWSFAGWNVSLAVQREQDAGSPRLGTQPSQAHEPVWDYLTLRAATFFV